MVKKLKENLKTNRYLTFFSLLIYIILGIYITYPLIFHMDTYVNGEIVIPWIQSWDIHVIFTNPFHIFDANAYYPFHNTLAYSETFLTTSLLAAPVYFF